MGEFFAASVVQIGEVFGPKCRDDRLGQPHISSLQHLIDVIAVGKWGIGFDAGCHERHRTANISEKCIASHCARLRGLAPSTTARQNSLVFYGHDANSVKDLRHRESLSCCGQRHRLRPEASISLAFRRSARYDEWSSSRKARLK